MKNFYYNLAGGLNTQFTPIKLGADTQKTYWADAYNIEPYKNQGVIRQKGNQPVLNLAEKLLEKPKEAVLPAGALNKVDFIQSETCEGSKGNDYNTFSLKAKDGQELLGQFASKPCNEEHRADIDGSTNNKMNSACGFDVFGAQKESAQSVLSSLNPVGLLNYPKGTKNFLLGLSDGRIYYFQAGLGILRQAYDFGQEISEFSFEYFLDGAVILPIKYAGEAIDGIYYNLNASDKAVSLNFVEAHLARLDGVLPAAVCQYSGRLWISAGNTLYYSALGTFNDWTSEHDAGYIANFHSSTANILALKEYSGSLAIYKRYEVFLLSGNDPKTFAITKFADKGVCGASSVLTCNNKQYFFNECGLFSLSYAGELAQIVMSSNRAKNIAKLFEKLDLTRLEEAVILSLELKNQIWIFPPIQGEHSQKEVWIYDWELDSWFIRIIPYEITSAATVSGEIYTISPEDGGRIFFFFLGNTFSLKPIKFKFSTPFFNFSKPTTTKLIDDFEIVCDGAVENNFDFSISTDYVTESATVPENVHLDLPNVLVWEDDSGLMSATTWAESEVSGAIWSDVIQESLKLDIFEANEAVQLHFEGSREGQDLAIIGFEFKGIVFED